MLQEIEKQNRDPVMLEKQMEITQWQVLAEKVMQRILNRAK
jgi:hypothetical protein